jgi:beta-lactam-binding protein with PASTA domain
MKKEIKYHTDPTGKCTVYSGKKVIARSYLGDNGYSVRILQGMNRDETMKKIAIDCPEFLKANKIPENYYPLLFSK